MRQESHRIFLQHFAPRSAAGSSTSYLGGAPTTSSSPTRGQDPSGGCGGSSRAVVTTSAAVRVTDGARASDVTKLLRGKFGLPSAAPGMDSNRNSSVAAVPIQQQQQQSSDRLDRIRSRLSQFRGSDVTEKRSVSIEGVSTSSGDVPSLEPGQFDALVLVATLQGLPKNFVEFEHEVGARGSASGGSDVSVQQADANTLSSARREGKNADEGKLDGPPAPDLRLNMDRSRSVSSAVTVKASNAAADVQKQQLQARRESSLSSTAVSSNSVDSTTREGGASHNRDPNRDPLALSSSQGYSIVKVDPNRVRRAPGSGSGSIVSSPSSSSPARRSQILGEKSSDALEPSLHDGVPTTGSTNGGWAESLPKLTPTGIEVDEDGTTELPPKLKRQASPPTSPSLSPTTFRQIHISSPARKRVDYEVSPQPYNIIRTLLPDEFPLAIRDSIVRTLINRLRKAEIVLGLDPREDDQLPTPQVRWFFQPSHQLEGGKISGRAMNVAGCIDLEGYCSEADEYIDEEDDENDEFGESSTKYEIKIPDVSDTSSVVDGWWRKRPASLRDAKVYEYCGRDSIRSRSTEQNRLSDERHRLAILSRHLSSSTSDGNCLCGYLLKRSKRDHNVWHRVHCVLTEDTLFWVTRMKVTTSAGANDQPALVHTSGEQHNVSHRGVASPIRSVHFGPSTSSRHRISRIGRHHTIRLTSTLLIESDPTQSSNPLSNVPNSFEIICPNGQSHIFRAPPPSIVGFTSSSVDPRDTCQRWVSAISETIVRCFENNGMELAEMIASDEASVRWGRTAGLAVTSFLGSMPSGAQSMKTHGAHLLAQSGWEADSTGTSSSAPVAEILRLGLDIASYRETIRNAQSVLHAGGREGDTIIGRLRHGAISSSWDFAEHILIKSSCLISMIEAKPDDTTMLEGLLNEDDDENRGSTENTDKMKADALAAYRRIALYLEEQKVLRERMDRGEDPSKLDMDVLLIPPTDIFDELLEMLQRLGALTEEKLRRRDVKRGKNFHSYGVLAGLPPIIKGN